MYTRIFRKKYYYLLFFFLFISFNLLAQEVTLTGRVLKINSGREPIANVNIKSDDGANSVLSNTNGSYTLKFQEQGYGAPVYIKAQKKGYELVNETEMDLYLPNAEQEQNIQLEVILCEAGYLDQARTDYYKITNTYIKKQFQKRYDKIYSKKAEGWEKEIAKLQEESKILKKQLKKQAEEYIRTNRDDLSEKELEARRLFEEGKIDESLKVRESMNSEEELKKELENKKRADQKISKAKKEKSKSEVGIEVHRRNLKEAANGFILKSKFDKAEQKLRALATIDSLNYNSVSAYAFFLAEQNKEKEAITIYEKILKLPINKSDIALVKNNLGTLYLTVNQYDKSLLNLQEALNIRLGLAETSPEKYNADVSDSQNNLGNLYLRLNNNHKALESYQEALRIRKGVAKADPQKYKSEVASVLSNLGIVYKNLNENEKALESFKESLIILKLLIKTNPQKYKPDIASTHLNLGEFYRNLNKYDKALASYKESLNIYKSLAEDNPEKYKPDLANIQVNLGIVYKDLYQFDKALVNCQKSLGIYINLAKINPEKYEPRVAQTQNILGVTYKELRQYNNALSSYRESLNIYKRLAEENPEKYELNFAKTQINLGVLYRICNDYVLAEKIIQQSLLIFQQQVKVNPEEIEPLIGVSLISLGNVYNKLKKNELSVKSFLEALNLYKRLAKKNPEKFNQDIALVLYALGNFYTKQNNYEAGLEKLNTALLIYEKLAVKTPDKYEIEVANSHIGLGFTYEKQNNYVKALQNYTNAYSILKKLSRNNPDRFEVDFADLIVCIGRLQIKFRLNRNVKNIEFDIDLARKIYSRHPNLPKAKENLSSVKFLITYFNIYDLANEIDDIKKSINSYSISKKIKNQRIIIANYNNLQKLGYEARTSIGKEQGTLAYYLLFAKDFNGAKQSAKVALNPTFEKPKDYDANVEWVHTNLALSLLLQGKYEEAKVIYKKFKDKQIQNKTYKVFMLEDLDALEKEGITHPDVAKIRKLLEDE